MSPNGRKPNGPPKGPGGVKPPQIPGKTAGFWILLVVLVFLVYQMIYIDRSPVHELTYTAFKEQVEGGNIRSVAKTGLDVNGELREALLGKLQRIRDPKAIDWLLENGKSKAKKVTFKDYMNPPAS